MQENQPQAENQLQVIVRESGLETTKAQVILEKFQDYFRMAADWEVKAHALVVTDAGQTAEMKMARDGRLFLQKRRTEVENTRKQLKEQALREGKAIDGIANILKALIVPIEEHLDRQEHFVEIKQAEEDARLLAEARTRSEEERLAKEKAEAEEHERVRLDNIRLRAEAEERERAIAEESRKHQAELDKAEAERKSIEEKARKERETAALAVKQAKDKAEAERKKTEAANQKLSAAKTEIKEMKAEVKTHQSREIECPFCHKKFTPAEVNQA